MIENKSLSVVVQEDENGELYIELPANILEDMGWEDTSNLEWHIEQDGSIILREKEDNDVSHEA